MKAPFPYFGGKSSVAHLVWERFGDVQNFVEPFCGSCAVLLARPSPPKIETVNDKDCVLSNFWRALVVDPEAVAKAADWPVNEADLEARHGWLVRQTEFRERMKNDPDYFDAKIAGWWVWGLSAWIGSGWCADRPTRKLPHLGDAGKGVHRQLPHLGNGRGVHQKRPALTHVGRGVHAQSAGIYEWFQALSDRLRRVRVCCGDWTRVLGPSVTEENGVTGIFLDPPYSAEAGRNNDLYREESLDVAHAVREWALANGDNHMLRIALCGYQGEHTMPDTWECVPWKAHGGYSTQNKKAVNLNNTRERIWFSPACIQPDLFSAVHAEAAP